MGEKPCGEVSEVPRGNDEGGQSAFGELTSGFEVLEGLRDESRDIDRVRGSQIETLREFAVGEGGFDEALAIVKGSVDFESRDVSAKGGELFLLEGRDAALGIENDYPSAGDVMEGTGYGSSRIS